MGERLRLVGFLENTEKGEKIGTYIKFSENEIQQILFEDFCIFSNTSFFI